MPINNIDSSIIAFPDIQVYIFLMNTTGKRVLVTYKTQTGSTRDAAEVIAAVLAAQGFETTISATTEAGQLDRYDTVIVGAPINGMQWLPEAVEYIRKHATELAHKKTAFYCMSYIHQTGSSFWRKVIEGVFKPAKAIVNPVDTAIFGGRIGEPLPAPMRFIFGIPKNAPIDLWEKDAIADWAQKLAATLTTS